MALKIKNLISISMMIGIVIFFFYYVMNHLSDFKRLLFISVSNFWFIFIIGFIFIFVLFLNGFLLNTLMKPFGIFLQKKEWMALSVVKFFLLAFYFYTFSDIYYNFLGRKLYRNFEYAVSLDPL